MQEENRVRGSTIAIVVPVYNEEAAIEQFHQELVRVIDTCPEEFIIYYINDGSDDRSCEILREIAKADPRVSLAELSRNFGHQAALTAGIDLAEGDAVITMDGDGQHPPDLIPELIELFKSGNDIVLTQRISEQRIGFIKRFTSQFFYTLINRVGDTIIFPHSADFRLLSKDVVLELRRMREYHRFLRGMVAWMGYRVGVIPFKAPQRIAGYTKFSFKKMFRFAIDAIFSFSLVPIGMSIILGLLFMFLATCEMLYVLYLLITGNAAQLVPGWSSLMFVLLFLGGTILILLGTIGYYVGMIFQESKGRPIYLLKKEKEPRS
jgi:dolichol-phosphate mannosyltransferase